MSIQEPKLTISINESLDLPQDQECLVILGKLECPSSTHCQHIVENIIDRLKEDKIEVKFMLFFETQFEEIRDKLLMENLSFLEFTESPIIFHNSSQNRKTIIGGLKEFKSYLKEKYNFEDDPNVTEESYKLETTQNLKNFMSKNGNQYVYFEFELDETKEEPKEILKEKVIFELFTKDLPKTSTNFFKLCLGTTNSEGQKIGYKNSTIHRISPGSFITGGDIKIDGPKSIYGENFNDENYNIQHNTYGILGMVKKSNRNHTNECQFYVTLCPLNCFDKLSVAFGRVIKGYDTIKKIAKLDTYLQKPIRRVCIKDCGEYKI